MKNGSYEEDVRVSFALLIPIERERVKKPSNDSGRMFSCSTMDFNIAGWRGLWTLSSSTPLAPSGMVTFCHAVSCANPRKASAEPMSLY